MSRGRLPNLITLARILLSPVFIVFFMLGGRWLYAAFAVGLLFEVTDFLDGALARSRNEITGFGKLLDPLADSIARFTVFLSLLWGGYAHLFAVALIFYRDAIVSSVRTICAYENVIVAARFSGKLKAGFQSVGIAIILAMIVFNVAGVIHFDPKPSARVIVWIVAVATALSGVDYIRSAWPLITRFEERA
jgi:CDP-diacylglycerol--glycerol-3-phosphate 3-phosphatidyltransferase